MNEIEYIDTFEKLMTVCPRIKQQQWIAVDTEFLREKTYYPIFCLLQIATAEWVVCIDPLAIENMEPLYEALYDPNVLKIFHSCRQDLEIFYHLSGKIPGPVFDTQLAAPLLGYQDNPGYAMLVSNMLNINLSKAHTRTDWSARPLSKEQIKYAADDVIYLCTIYQKITEQLTNLGRLEWLEDDFIGLMDPKLYIVAPENAWLKIKSKNKLTGKQLSILQVLCQWREQAAQKENRPRNWLMRDDLLIEFSKLQPQSMTELDQLRGVNERIIKRYGKQLCHLVSGAINKVPIKLDEKKRGPKKSVRQEAVIDILSAVVRINAEQNSINQSILATRKDLEMLISGEQDCKLLQGWRYTMVGKELQAFLKGERVLKLSPKSVIISEISKNSC